MTVVTPFTLPMFDAEIADLKMRLTRLRWPENLPGAPWLCGVDVDYMKDFCAYWRDRYVWSEHAARLNKIPQFSAVVDGVRLTFWHVKAKSGSHAAVPLLLIHGWPGSQIEFEALVGPLTDPEAHGASGPAFDIVVPAIPGFGFGGKPAEPGWNPDRIADAFHALMVDVLGYRKFGIQGGDYGTLIGTRLCLRHAAAVTGFHLNMPTALPPPGTPPDAALAARSEQLTAYRILQRTKPDMLTVGQSDSPIALAAWTLDKFYTWSDCGGDVESAFSRDTLITNIMYYWLPNSVGSAARLYYESAQMKPPLFHGGRVTVPTGVAAFPREPFLSPRSWVEVAFTIVRWTDMESGGHFPALERPALLVEDVRAFFNDVIGA
jgi:epoxide hydrolase